MALLAIASMLHRQTLSTIARSAEVREDSADPLYLHRRDRTALLHCWEPWKAGCHMAIRRGSQQCHTQGHACQKPTTLYSASHTTRKPTLNTRCHGR